MSSSSSLPRVRLLALLNVSYVTLERRAHRRLARLLFRRRDPELPPLPPVLAVPLDPRRPARFFHRFPCAPSPEGATDGFVDNGPATCSDPRFRAPWSTSYNPLAAMSEQFQPRVLRRPRCRGRSARPLRLAGRIRPRRRPLIRLPSSSPVVASAKQNTTSSTGFSGLGSRAGPLSAPEGSVPRARSAPAAGSTGPAAIAELGGRPWPSRSTSRSLARRTSCRLGRAPTAAAARTQPRRGNADVQGGGSTRQARRCVR
jgi:hypothetical protein